MLFSSVTFLFFFLPITLMLHQLAPWRWKNHVLLVASVIFYASGEPRYIALLALSALVGWLHGLYMTRHPRCRPALISAIVWNLAFLLFFKYADFLTGSLNSLLGTSIPALGLSLPIGISFYTFQNMSYVLDVYRGDSRAERNFASYATYLCLFPQLIAGPIVRYSDVARELKDRTVDTAGFSRGVVRFTVGLGKKVLLANSIGVLAELTVPEGSVLFSWLRAIAYTFQIYFDFAGYSDMARGLGRMLGFEFCINFNYPYISKSVTEFWRRWHISLSTWFRDYVYIPLGGNRCGKIRQCVNILVVWALTGFWHGAGWNFLFWGFYYGILLLIEKLVLGKYIRRLPAPVQHLYTMVIVVIGWVFFASPDLSTALDYLQVMFSFTPGTVGTASLVMPWLGMGILGVLASTPLAKTLWEKVQDKKWMPLAEGALCLAGLLLCTASLVSDSYNPFLYFRF